MARNESFRSEIAESSFDATLHANNNSGKRASIEFTTVAIRLFAVVITTGHASGRFRIAD